MSASDEPDTATLALLLADRLVRRVQTHPVSTLAGAAGVGVVLARGIPNFALKLGASIAMRAVTARVVGQVAPELVAEPEAAE